MSGNLKYKTVDTVDTQVFKRLIMTFGELPASFVDSMTYYEMLAWINNYLETVVIPALNNNSEITNDLLNYFNNLDVQQEIDNKLDEMDESGELKNVFQIYLSEEIDAINTRINQQLAAQDEYIATALENTKSGAPIPVASTNQMTDTTRIYLNTTDGYWYYYNGTTWVSGGVYQSTGLAPNSVDCFNLNAHTRTSVFEDVDQSSVTYLDLGNYQGNTDLVSDSISTNEYLLFDEGDTITLRDTDNYRIRVVQINRETKAYVSQTAMLTGSYTIPAKNLYLIQISSNDNTRPSLLDIENIIGFTGLREKQVFPVKYSDLGFVKSSSIPYTSLELGNINSTGGNSVQPNRFRTKDLIPVKKGYIINVKGDFGIDFNIKSYDENGDYITQTDGWSPVGTSHYFKVDWNGYMRMVFRQNKQGEPYLSDDDLITFNNFVDIYEDLPSSLDFDPNAEIDLSDVVLPNSNIYETSAHRGQYNNQYPENSIVAYKVACDNKFDSLEIDTRFTSDNVAIIMHDSTINRIARYSDGTTLSSDITVADHTYSYLDQFDYGIYKGEQYAGTKLLTFEDVCKFTKFYNIRLNLDVKTTTEANINELARLVKKYCLTDRVKWTVGNMDGARRILSIFPKCRLFIGAWTPSAATVNNVLTLISEYPDAEIGIDCYVGNTSDAIMASIQDNELKYSAYCENNTQIVKAVLNGATDLTVNNILPYQMLKDYYDANF